MIQKFYLRVLKCISFLFKPTYRVFPSIQAAVVALPARGGTVLVAPGSYSMDGPIAVNNKVVRIIGAVKLGEEMPVLELSTGTPMVTLVAGEGATGSLEMEGLWTQGSSDKLSAYLSLESAVRHLSAIGSPLTDNIRDVMDHVWDELTGEEKKRLNKGRKGVLDWSPED